MKVTDRITVYAGWDMEKVQEGAKKEKQKAIYAAALQENTLEDRIEQKKKQAKEQAWKIVEEAWNTDRSIDEELCGRREHIEALQQENKDISDELEQLEQAQLKLPMEEGIEYEAYWEDLEKKKEACREKLKQNEGTILEENAILRATSLERLKTDPMGKAQKQADKVEEAAREGIVDMVVEASKEHIDEEKEKRQEEAEKIEEERKEQEALIEARREEKEETRELLEEMVNSGMLSLSREQNEVKAQVQDILNKMKLVAEDIKGTRVDEER